MAAEKSLTIVRMNVTHAYFDNCLICEMLPIMSVKLENKYSLIKK